MSASATQGGHNKAAPSNQTLYIRVYRRWYWTRISSRWQIRATCCITANVLYTSKLDAQFDKLATELNWQRFVSKVPSLQLYRPAFNLPHLHLAPPLEVTPFEFCRDFWHQKTRVPGGYRVTYVWCCLHDPTFSRFGRTPTCDGRTDRHTTTANKLAYTCASYKRRAGIKTRLTGLKLTIIFVMSSFSLRSLRLSNVSFDGVSSSNSSSLFDAFADFIVCERDVDLFTFITQFSCFHKARFHGIISRPTFTVLSLPLCLE